MSGEAYEARVERLRYELERAKNNRRIAYEAEQEAQKALDDALVERAPVKRGDRIRYRQKEYIVSSVRPGYSEDHWRIIADFIRKDGTPGRQREFWGNYEIIERATTPQGEG